MNVVETLAELKIIRQSWKNECVAFVPTMGALHEGHLALIEKARTLAPKVVVSIFVNPLQFAPHEDLNRYPRPKETDLRLCEQHGVHAVFYPSAQELYPQGLDAMTRVVPPAALVDQLCGRSRAGHFEGVATVVLKLFALVQPHYAVFGEKDAQQLAVIQRMVADLNLPVTIVPAPTVREFDGLAKSSRNQYLGSGLDRQQARLLSRLIIAVQELYQQGVQTREETFRLAQERVLDESLYPDFELEYLAAVNGESFLPTEVLDEQTRILVAARVGSVRLIDNALVSQPIRLEPSALMLH